MKTIRDFPHSVIVDDSLTIELPDGIKLSARLWLPSNATTHPVPVIIEHLPYRKRDGTIARDETVHPWFAGHGYACLRTDMRGNGDSEGFMDDEYTQQEWQDACDVINWAARQPWSNGRVGMMGISWGGFNSLQVAALNPPALKAVITVCSSVDRYADDIHYKGGCLLTENIAWAANMLSYSSRPPDKALVGERWKRMWLARLNHLPLLASTWHRHQTRDDYWKRGSICENYRAINAAVLAIGGWHDGYRNTISHLVSHLHSPVKGIVGPWNHKYPHYAAPQPAIGFLQEAKRWWDRWLKDENTGVEADPDYRVWLMDSIAPQRHLTERPGRWIAHKHWPCTSPADRVFHFDEQQTLKDIKPTQDVCVTIQSPQDCGRSSGEFFPFAFGPELPDDQHSDDKQSAVFDSPVLTQPIDIVGAPEVAIRAMSDQTSGLVCVRLCDLRPDGQSALISHGFLNLCHRDSAEMPSKLPLGEAMTLHVTLDQIAYRIPASHRLRIAVSTSYWPFIWPSASVMTLSIMSGSLTIPQRLPAESPLPTEEVGFEPPEGAPDWEKETLRPTLSTRNTFVDNESGDTITDIVNDFGEFKDRHHGLQSGSKTTERWRIHPDDPLSATASITWHQSGGRDGAHWSSDVTVNMSCTAQTFLIQASVTAFENETVIFSREYHDVVPRDWV